MIKVKNLSKSFGKKQVLKDLSFTVNDGEVYGLLGQNAAGKTTTLRILSTLLKPTSGQVTIEGFDVVQSPLDVRKVVGFLPEEAGLYDRLTPRETLQYYGRLHKLNDEDLASRIDTLFGSLELEEFSNIKCSKLSKGTKQKVSIARCLIHDPHILFLDEPTANVDATSAYNIKRVALQRIKENRTIILSSHDLHQVSRLCNRVGIINDGKLLVEGTVDELKSEYAGEDLEEIYINIIQNSK